MQLIELLWEAAGNEPLDPWGTIAGDPIDDPSGPRRPEARRTRSVRPMAPSKAKKKRKVSKYQRAFGKNLKKLKKAHPRTAIGTLMKRAHRMTRKELK